MEVNVKERGAFADGITDDTACIQAAIDACNGDGGGTVTIDSGVYLVTHIKLKSNVTLVLNGTLTPNSDAKSALKLAGVLDENNTSALISATNAENIEINGTGCIDGKYMHMYNSADSNECISNSTVHCYFKLIYMENIKNLHIFNVLVKNATNYAIILSGCKYVKCQGINISGDQKSSNMGGICINRSAFVHITNCSIVAPNNAICIKCTENTTQYGDCYEIRIDDCVLTSHSAAIKLGTSCFGDFYNFYFDNIQIISSNRGLSLQIRNSCTVHDIIFNNISIETLCYLDKTYGNSEPIYVTFLPLGEADLEGCISNITFQHITINSENGIILYTNKPHQIDNILFDDVSFMLKSSKLFGQYDLRPYNISETVIEKSLPIFNYNCSNVTYRNVIIDDEDKQF